MSRLKLLVQMVIDSNEISDNIASTVLRVFPDIPDEMTDMIHQSQVTGAIPYPLNVELLEQVVAFSLFDQDGTAFCLPN